MSISFEEFASRCANDTDNDLRNMAKEEGIRLTPRAKRDTILRMLYTALGEETASPEEAKSPEILPSEPKEGGADYTVFLRATQPRWRGKRHWALGMTRVSHEEMHENNDFLKKALDSDKSFKIVKLDE